MLYLRRAILKEEVYKYCGGEFKEADFLRCLKGCGLDAKVFKNAQIIKPELVVLGRACQIDDFVWMLAGQGIEVGDRVHIAVFTSIGGGGRTIIESYAGLSAGCRIISGSEEFMGQGMTNPCIPKDFRVVRRSEVVIEKHALLFTNTIVFPGVRIGQGAVVSAGSIVSRNLEPWGIYRMKNGKIQKVADRKKDVILAGENELIASLGY